MARKEAPITKITPVVLDVAKKAAEGSWVRGLLKSIAFVICFAAVAPFALILFNQISLNCFHWVPISDLVIITVSSASTGVAVLQTLGSKALQKILDRSG